MNSKVEEEYKALIRRYAEFFAGEAKYSNDLELKKINEHWKKVYSINRKHSFIEAEIKANEAVLHDLLMRDTCLSALESKGLLKNK